MPHIWLGTPEEAGELRAAVTANCACEVGSRCGAHKLLDDERLMNRLVFVRRIRERLKREEQSDGNNR